MKSIELQTIEIHFQFYKNLNFNTLQVFTKKPAAPAQVFLTTHPARCLQLHEAKKSRM